MTSDPATAPEIPDKLYFKIGEVSDIAEVPAYVLRFWESEFKRINPKRTASGQRLYRRSDIDLILKIKDLLYSRKFTIQGARRYLCGREPLSDPGSKDDDIMSEIRAELLQIKDILET